MENIETAQAKSDALPVVIGISIEEDDLDDLHSEPKSLKVGTLVDQFSHGSNGSPFYSKSSSTGEHETVQKKAFTKWLNSHLSKKGYPLINNLYHDLRDGTILIALLDVLCDTKIKLERGRLRVHHLNNVARALQVLDDRQVKLVNISTNDIVDGNAKLTLGLLWCIILHWQVNHIFSNSTSKRLLPLPLCPENSPTVVQLPITSSPLAEQSSESSSRPNSQQSSSNSSPRPSRIPISPVVPPKPAFGIRNNNPNSNLKQPHSNEQSTLTAGVSSAQPAAAAPPAPPLGTMSQNDLEKTLLFWCQEATKSYEAVDIKNFTTSWSDGFAFNALINHFRPNLFSYGEVLAMETAELRLQHAFDLAAKHLHIEKLLDPEDLITPRPDKKSVLMYVMCLFQALDAPTAVSADEQSAKQSSSTGGKVLTDYRTSDIPVLASSPKTAISKSSAPKRPPPSSPQSNIPVLSPDFQKRFSSKKDSDFMASKKMCTTSSLETSKDSGVSTFDPAILNEYHTDIEDILTWLLGAEEQLGSNVDADNHRFEAAAASAASAAQLEAEKHENPSVLNKLRHKRIMATIDAAEYAKQRFEHHEKFMRDLADYYKKIIKTFDKGQQLIYSTSGGSSTSDKSLQSFSKVRGNPTSASASFGSTSSTGSSISVGSAPAPSSSAAFDMESKRVIALQMQLLDDRFNQLRAKATNHQHYLHQMLIKTQNAQLEELRRLMTQTEERIAVIIPEKFDEMPSDQQSLAKQIAAFEQLQETMLAEQGLLNLISKFVIIDTEEVGSTGQNSSKDANFLDQLEALNERWANACLITESRGKFLHKLNDAWADFSAEEGRLFDWFNRLERRLSDMEESIDELEEKSVCLDSAAKSQTVKQERKFLEDIKKRLDRMQIDIFYGTEKSHKLHAGSSNADDEDELPTTPLSKITQLTHTLLGQFSDQGICSTVTRSIETIRNRWETLAGRIEQATKVVVKRTEQLDLAIMQHPPEVNEVDRSVAPKKPPRDLPLLQKVQGNASSVFATMTTEETTVSTKVISAQSSTKQSTPTTPSSKRRKVDFCGVVDWQNMLDSMSKWIENMESNLIELSVSGELFENFPKNAIHQVEPPTSCSDVATNLKMYSELVEKASSVQKLLAKHFLTNKTPNSANIQSEIDQLALMENDLANRNKDFNDIVQKGEKIIVDYKNANEEHMSLEGVLETFKKRWSTFKYGLERSQLYSQVWCSMQSMVEESANMKHVLEKYHKRFSENVINLKQLSDKEKLETLRQQVDLCSISIQGQYSKLEEFDSKLSQLYLQTPALFFCWPEPKTDGEKKYAWKRLSPEKFTTKVTIAPLQWNCFLLSIDLLSLHQIWSIMSDAGQSLIQSIDAALESDFDLKEAEEDTSADAVDDKETDWIQKSNISSEKSEISSLSSEASGAYSDNNYDADDDDGSPTKKLMIAIDALNSWLKNVINVVEEYDEDESDVENEEAEEAQPVSLGSNRSKVPGSKLKSLADLANAIDNRVYVLADLQKTVDAEQENYHFACKRAAEIIFGSKSVLQLTSLQEIEERIKSLDVTSTDDEDAQLIESIQTLVSRWHLVFAKFQTLLTQLEEISPSTTLLEPEFAQINRWIEESVQFLNEAIAVGCLDTLSEQLCECERLKDYMERSVEKSFQTILSTAKEAVRILLGKSNFEVPVIAHIQETWSNLGQRTLTKLDRLRLAQDLTQKLIKSLDEHQTWLRDFEINILREGNREVNKEELSTLYEELKEDVTVENFNWSLAIPGKLQLNKLQSKRSEYLRATLEPPDSLLSQMQSFYNNGSQSNHVFDKLKKRAKTEIVRAFDALENKLKTKIAKTEAHLNNLTRLVQLSGKEQSQLTHFKMLLTDVETKQRKAMENTEDANIALKDLEKILNEAMSVSRQSRLDEIQSLLSSNSNLVQFLLDSSQKAIIEDQQNQLEEILTEDSRLRAQAEAEVELVEKFASNWKECDSRLCALQKWFQEQTVETVSLSEISSKQEELHTIDKLYSEKFSVFRTAKSRLKTRVELVQQIINEFTRDQLFQKEKSTTNDNFEDKISQMEQFLADLGLVINELEVTLDEESFIALSQEQGYCPESELQLIPAMLQKVIDSICVSYEDQLNEFQHQLNTLKSNPSVSSTFEKRLAELGKTHEALVSSLHLRRFLLEELIELCGQINNKLIDLEEECSKVFSVDKNAIEEADLEEMKQSSHKILADVCQLKERLDIHCIRHSEILIGIEEVGARYDEIITEIAEQYVDVDGEEEEKEEKEETENEASKFTETNSDGGPAVPEQVRYRPTNLASTSAAAHLSTITEEVTSPVDPSTTTVKTTVAKASQIIPEIKVSSPDKKLPPLVPLVNIETVMEQIRTSPYSVKPYIQQLQTLERKINSISCSTGLTSISKGPKLSISLVEDELHRLNKCLNEVRAPYELALCAASVSGFIMAAASLDNTTKKNNLSPSPESLPQLPDEPSKWDEYSSEVVKSLNGLQSEFGHSWNRFLSLHRHWWLVRDATLQFNSEIRKLADWFENVELQLTNGRITTVTVDDSQPYGCFTFEVDDLNYPNVARTQLLLIAQLRSHISIFAKIQVLYNRLVQCFTPDDEMSPSSSFEDRKALLDARNRIQHEWNQVSLRWNAIVRELAWRRECLVALAAGTMVVNVSGYPYKRGDDADFDKVLDDYLRYESANTSSNSWFQLEQLMQWQSETEEGLETIREKFIISDIESSHKLASKVREYQQELSRQLLNWIVITQEPFTNQKIVRQVSLQHGQTLTTEQRANINASFQKITLNLFEMCYFTEVFSTCFTYISSLTKSELEWVISAHEHLNAIEDYLALRFIDFTSSANFSELPVGSLAFVQSLKDNLITHENNIEQVMTIVNELNQHGKVQLSLDLRLDAFMNQFELLSRLRTHLLGRLRTSGLTVWAALHHLLKQCYCRLQSYRSLMESNLMAEQAEAALTTQSATGSLRSHQRFQQHLPHQHHQYQQQSRHPRQLREASSATNSLHRQQATARQQSKMVADLRSYYRTALEQFNYWLALESHILSYYCALSQQSGSVEIDSDSKTTDDVKTKSTSSTPVMQPARVLKFTIRRCEDFLTEFHFGKSVLSQVWCELNQLNVQQTSKETLNKNNDNQTNEYSSSQEVPINQLEPVNHHWHQSIEEEIMERIRDLQREHHKRSLAHLLNSNSATSNGTTGTSNGNPTNQHQQTPPAVPPKPKSMGSSAFNSHQQNVYDTVADALEDSVPAPTPTYHRPFESEQGSPAAAAVTTTINNNASSANLDMQRQEVEMWLSSMEKRFGDFVAEYNQAVLQRRKSSFTNHKDDSSSGTFDSITETSLKKQLTIISSYQSELTQYSAKLSSLNSSVDARIASLAPNGSDIKKSNISMPYYDHLVELRKKCDEMQIRLNDLYLSIKCKLRSLQELFHTSTSNGSAASSASSRINLMSSGLVNGAGLDLGIDFHGTSSSSSKSSKLTVNGGGHQYSGSSARSAVSNNGANAAVSGSGTSGSGSDSLPHSGSGSASSQATTVAAVSSYALHESSEKRFAKWLQEIETSLQFIEKRLEAESALNENGGQAKDTDDDPLYTNVSEMQQMHMNYFEKVKIMQREIEQKRTDHRILMELLETDSESDATTSQSRGQSGVVNNNSSSLSRDQQKRAIDPWLARFRNRVEMLNTRWNSIRLRVLTLRSRLESSSMFASSLTTTVPATPSSASMYSINGGYGYSGYSGIGSQVGGHYDETASSIAATVVFNNAASERASQLLLSLRELVEWIIKRQTEFESQQMAQHQAQLQIHSNKVGGGNVPLDVANVMQQKSSLLQLRTQLTDKRPIIDSSLLACHNLLRRLAIKRAQDVQQARLPPSASMASSIASSAMGDGNSSHYDPLRVHQIRAAKRQELAELETTISREMQRLLEVWNNLQVNVEMKLQRLDDAHLRLTDLQRAMEDLAAKLHEAEFSKSQWLPIVDIPFDQIPQQKANLKNYSQLYVSAIARDAVHVNELAARLTGRNVPLSHANLKTLEEVTTRARLLQVSVDERARELEQAVHDHGNAQQHFLTEAVDAPWERAVTANKLPCYINRNTESVQITSPRYTEIMFSLSEFNRVRYAAYRTAMKLRSLQEKLGLDFVSMDILAEAFEQHGLGPNAPSVGSSKNKSSTASKTNGSSLGEQSGDTSAATSSNLVEDINEDLPYELRLIAVPEIISCLKMIFEMVSASAAIELAAVNPSELRGTMSKKSKNKNGKDKKDSELPAAANINVPLCVDLCLNWVLALYDAPSRSGYIRQFSFQVALVLLSKISLEQKYLYLFNLIADDNGYADERRLGLLIYDCLRLPKLLGEVAAFGGTNIEPSVRSCLEMANSPAEGVTGQQVLDWIRAEPQSLVWLLVLHRLRLAEKSRHPAKCNLCRSYPIVGFRYRCLKCFNFDLCQECFLCDMATKKHKSSHPMQEYCVATTSGEDMRDFTRILRNKFKSGRYFKRHQALGYLPVQSLHEGDRLEESSAMSQFVHHTMQGSYSHNPSSNTTPVHTLPYPMRAASPGALTQRDLDFVLDSGQGTYGGRGFQGIVDTRSSLSSSSSLYGHRTGIVGGTHMVPPPLPPQSMRRQTSVEQSHMMMSGQRSATSTLGHPHHPQQYQINSPFDRRLPQYHSTPVSPVHSQQKHDDVHNRLGAYASRLAEAETGSRTPHRSLSQRTRGSQQQFDSVSGGGASSGRSKTLPLHSDDHVNHYDLVQSPTDMLSKIAADQRSELEQIIQRLEEENKMLVTEYNQLNEEQTIEGDQSKAQNESKQAVSNNKSNNSNHNSNSSIERKGSASDEFSPLYENVINSLERRQKKREQQKLKSQSQESGDKYKSEGTRVNGGNNGAVRDDSIDSLETAGDDDPPSSISANPATSGPIPAYLLEEARQLRQSKTRLESRKVELEKCNQLLESQLTHFKTYISNSGALDAKTKKRLAKSIVEMERMLDTPSSSSPSTPMKSNGSTAAELLMASAATRVRKPSASNGGGGTSDANSNSDTSTPLSSTYTPPSHLLHSAADRVNSAVENLVEAFTEPEDTASSYSSGTATSTAAANTGSRYNGKK